MFLVALMTASHGVALPCDLSILLSLEEFDGGKFKSISEAKALLDDNGL